MAGSDTIPDFTESSGDNGPEEYGVAAAGDKTVPGGVKLSVTQDFRGNSVSNHRRTNARLAVYLAVCNLVGLALSADNPGMAKWHILCLFLVFRYKLFLATERVTDPVGTPIPREGDNNGAVKDGCQVTFTDVKLEIVTKYALAEMYAKATPRLKGIVDIADKAAIEACLSIENLRRAMALIFSLKINFYLTNHHVSHGEFVGVGKKMWNFVCSADKGSVIDHTHSAYNDAWKLGHAFSTAGGQPTYDLEYADDTLVFGISAPALESYLHALQQEAQPYGLELNLTKTELLVHPSFTPPPPKFLNGDPVPQAMSVKYLGSQITWNNPTVHALFARSASPIPPSVSFSTFGGVIYPER